jgi:uncharacterized lipoprotein NlpE involved in copper resistance
MKRLFFPTLIMVCLMGFLSCKSSKPATAEVANPQQSLSWDGTYTGILPCTDCQSEQTTLTLGKDMMYKVTIKYNGKTDGEHKYVGRFNWNPEGSMITLSPPFEGGMPHSYMVGQNTLTLIDMNARVIKGKNVKSYVLTKS